MFLNTISVILSILGSVALFLFGMKLMSESLQSVAGKSLRRILGTLSSSKGRGLLSGTALTGTIQSSSAVTVLIVSFVGAGLLSLNGAYGLILGANIGTTATGWIVSLLGFNVQMDRLSLPIIAIGLPLLFSRQTRRKKTGEFLIGFALLFMGLMFLRMATPDLREIPAVHSFLSEQAGYGFLSELLFLIIGFAVTAMIQSSSAAMAFTVVLAVQGWISLDLAGAMILGENIGTTITANLAATVGNRESRIAARVHFVFNLLGSIWALLLLQPFLSLNQWLVEHLGFGDNTGSAAYISAVLAAFHSSFNIINALLLISFPRLLIGIATRLVASRKDEKRGSNFIESPFHGTAELALVQVRAEIISLNEKVIEMLSLVPRILMEKREEKYGKLLSNIRELEQEVNDSEQRIVKQLTHLTEHSLSQESSHQISTLLRVVDDFESIGDACFIMAVSIDEKNQNKVWFTQEMRERLLSLFDTGTEGLRLVRNRLRLEENIEPGQKPSTLLLERLQQFKSLTRLANPPQGEALEVYSKLSDLACKVIEYSINICQYQVSADGANR
jgi:phosphate:Na+ symporter